MDSAFRRPGRFDQIVFVPPPDRGARVAILSVLLRDRPAAGVDLERVAAATDGYSGADLMGMVDRAIDTKLAAALREGVPHPLTTDDLLRATKSVGATTREWFATVRNYVLYANEGGLYDPVRPYLKGR
jgi:SpoVK/Ycf46/Vps4 family AAA+-type ATPase